MREMCKRVRALSSTVPTAVVLLLAILVIPSGLRAESIFMKDGRIVEGKIVSETDSVFNVYTTDKKSVSLTRSKVLRITNEKGYKEKKYIKKKDGDVVEGFIVEENADEYTIREKLDSPVEFKLAKNRIEAMSSEMFLTKGAYYAWGFVPGVAQFYAEKDLEGAIFLGLFSCSVLVTGYTYYDYYKKKQEYLDVERGSPQSEFDSKYDEYKNAGDLFIGAMVITGVIYIANLVDVIFFAAPDFGDKKKTAGTGDVFYNVTLGDMPSVDCTADKYSDVSFNNSITGGSIFTVSAGVRF